jgi:hypothetical protein
MEGNMRLALPLLVIAAALSLPAHAGPAFECFVTPQGETRCSCVGEDSCLAMNNSKSCLSDPECDHAELGAVICSCKAVRGAGASR